MGSPEPPQFTRLQAWINSWTRHDASLSKSRLHRLVLFWIQVGRVFAQNRGPARASSLAYTTLLALVPLLAVSLSVAALFLPRDEGERKEQLLAWIEFGVARAAPTLGLIDEDGRTQREMVASNIASFVDRIHFKTIGAAATAGLLIVVISLLRAVEVTFNDIWGVTRSRSLGLSIAYYWAAITLGPVVILASKGANYLVLLDSSTPVMGDGHWGSLLAALSYGIMPTLMALVFATLYFCMPNTHVPWRAALFGGFVASVLWTLNGKLSALYNTRVLTTNAIYGSLGVLPLFLVGLYFTWFIVLFGAQVASTFQNRGLVGQYELKGQLGTAARESSAVRLMALIGRQFAAGSHPRGARPLAEALAVPLRFTEELLEVFVQARLLNRIGPSEPGYAPARPLQQISVRDVLHAVRSPRTTWNPGASEDETDRAVRFALEKASEAGDAAAEAVTMDDLIRSGSAAKVPGEVILPARKA